MDDMTQTLEQAQETNRRLNRRLGATEAHLHSLVSKAFDQVAESQRMAQRALDREAGAQSNRDWMQRRIEDFESKRADKVLGGWVLFAWAAIATTIAVWLYYWR